MEKTENKVRERKTLTDEVRRLASPVVEPIVSVFARWRLSPDVLTVVGMLAHFFLAWLLATGRWQATAIAIPLIAPLDALDGALARKLGRKMGGFGAFLDSTLDRLAEIILFGGFIYYYVQVDNPVMLATAYIAVTGSLMVSYTRSKAETLGFSAKVGVLSRVERYMVLVAFLLFNRPDIALIILAAGTYLTTAQRIFHVWRQAVRDEREEEEK